MCYKTFGDFCVIKLGEVRELREGRVVHLITSKKNGELIQTWRSTHSSQSFHLDFKHLNLMVKPFDHRQTFDRPIGSIKKVKAAQTIGNLFSQ